MRHAPTEETPLEEVLALLADAFVLMSAPGAPRTPGADELREVLTKAIVLSAALAEDA